MKGKDNIGLGLEEIALLMERAMQSKGGNRSGNRGRRSGSGRRSHGGSRRSSGNRSGGRRDSRNGGKSNRS